MEVEDSGAVLISQRLTQALNDPEMSTPTPEKERVPIITQPYLATRILVTKHSKKTASTSRAKPAVAGQ